MMVERECSIAGRESEVVTVRRTWNSPKLARLKGLKGAVQVESSRTSGIPFSDLLGMRPRVIWDILVASVRSHPPSVLQKSMRKAARADISIETNPAVPRSPISAADWHNAAIADAGEAGYTIPASFARCLLGLQAVQLSSCRVVELSSMHRPAFL